MDLGAPMPGRLAGTAGLAKAGPAPASTLVIFGAGGDLTRRLLMPSLYNLQLAHLLDESFQVIGVDHNESEDEKYRQTLTESMQGFVTDKGGEFAADGLDAGAWGWIRSRLHYQTGDFEDAATYEALKARMTGNCVFYLAVAARFFGPVITHLADAGLMQEADGAFRRVVVEKPFGHDLPSAKALNALILEKIQESQVFRIDHFLGKETVQNIMALRFSNGIFEPLWNRFYIDHVQITAAETVGVEERGKFYEATGALRDMVPNHMFQLLAMTAMEPPNSFDADAVRAEKAKVLQALKPLDSFRVARDVVRGQYGAGRVMDKDVSGYRQEPDVARESTTETYVAMRMKIDNFRWAGVPFYIRTGKWMTARKTEIAIHFKQAPYAMFRDSPVDKLTPNVMVLHIQPHEGITLNLSAKIPGPMLNLGAVAMDFRYDDYFKAPFQHGLRDAAVRRDGRRRRDPVPACRHGGSGLGRRAADPRRVGRGPDRGLSVFRRLARAGTGGCVAGTGRPPLAEAMSMPIRLVVSDVDGTLVQTDKSLAPSTIAAVARLQAAGIPLAIVSARPPRGMQWLQDALHLTGPLAGFNGGSLVAPDGRVIEQRLVPAEAARTSLAVFKARGVSAWLFTAREWLILDPSGPHVDHERHTVRFHERVVDSFDPYLDQAGKLVGCTDDAPLLAAVEAELQTLLGDTAAAKRSQTYYLDVTHREANKGNAIRLLAAAQGITVDEVAVLGDMMNDVPMFKVAGYSVAMGNASAEVKGLASAVTEGNDHGGWAEAIDTLILPRTKP